VRPKRTAGRTAPPALILIAAASLAPRLIDALRRPVDYNGYWHVFIARNLGREWHNLSHPPLFLVLLRASDAVSHSVLAYRFWPLLAGAVSVYLVGRLLLHLRCGAATAALGTAAIGFSTSAIRLSNEVESYALCVAFVLGSLFSYFDIVAAPGPRSARPRVVFAACASVALALHYFAGLFLAAAAIAPLAVAAFDAAYRRDLFRNFGRRWRADAATLAVPGAVGLALYELQAKVWVRALSSLPGFYFEPGKETAAEFLARNLRETFNLFSPVALPRARLAIPALAIFVAAALWLVARERRRGGTSPARLFPAAILVILLALGMALGLLGLYPFGGLMRHQFLIFLFALLAGMAAVDAAVRSLPRGRAAVLVGSLAALLAVSFATRLPQLLRPAPDPLRPIVSAREAVLRQRGGVTVDQFGLIALFSQFAGSDWRFRGALADNSRAEVYAVDLPGGAVSVLALRDWWIFDLSSARLFDELARAWKTEGSDCHGFLRFGGQALRPDRKPVPAERRAAFASRLSGGAAAQGLRLENASVSPYGDVDAVFCGTESPRTK
jgi:hypothetical protein